MELFTQHTHISILIVNNVPLRLDCQGFYGGLVTLWWLDGRWTTFNETRVKFYVDEETEPGIDVQLYAAVGMGFDDESRVPWGNTRLGSVGNTFGIYTMYCPNCTVQTDKQHMEIQREIR